MKKMQLRLVVCVLYYVYVASVVCDCCQTGKIVLRLG